MRSMNLRCLMLLLAGTVALAGCLEAGVTSGPDAAENGVAEAPAPTNASAPEGVVRQYGCDSFYGGHTVDEAWAEARLPEGLSPWTNSAGAWLLVKTWTCERGDAGSEDGFTGPAMVYYLAVVADERYASDEVGFAWYPLEIIGPQNLVDRFEAWGFTVAGEGAVNVAWEETPAGRVAEVQGRGRATVDAHVTLTRFRDAGGDGIVRYYAGDGEHVTGAVDITVHAGLRGGGESVVRMDGEHAYAPAGAPLPGGASYQGWAADELSYTWVPVTFEAP